jgi:hypothetical protein
MVTWTNDWFNKSIRTRKLYRNFCTNFTILFFLLFPISCHNILFHMIPKFILILTDLLYEPDINFWWYQQNFFIWYRISNTIYTCRLSDKKIQNKPSIYIWIWTLIVESPLNRKASGWTRIYPINSTKIMDYMKKKSSLVLHFFLNTSQFLFMVAWW